MNETADFFRVRLDQMIDLRHPLAVRANRIPWQKIEASIAHRFTKQARAGKRLADVGLFGCTVLWLELFITS
jgi:IS5 family transposase